MSDHEGQLLSSEKVSIQQIADALAGAELRSVNLAKLETAALLNALEQCQGNRTYAARLLGISVRTLQRKLKALDRPDSP